MMDKTKLITITVLVIAICGMTLGFAAFSNVLTISSSASVTPNDDEFDIVVYGVDEAKVDFDYMEPSFYTSLTSSVGFVDDSDVLVDGPFEVGFEDLQFAFRTAPVGEVINP